MEICGGEGPPVQERVGRVVLADAVGRVKRLTASMPHRGRYPLATTFSCVLPEGGERTRLLASGCIDRVNSELSPSYGLGWFSLTPLCGLRDRSFERQLSYARPAQRPRLFSLVDYEHPRN